MVRRIPIRAKVAGALAVPLVALVVFVTANHYLLDAVAGATLGLVARRLARRLS